MFCLFWARPRSIFCSQNCWFITVVYTLSPSQIRSLWTKRWSRLLFRATHQSSVYKLNDLHDTGHVVYFFFMVQLLVVHTFIHHKFLFYFHRREKKCMPSIMPSCFFVTSKGQANNWLKSTHIKCQSLLIVNHLSPKMNTCHDVVCLQASTNDCSCNSHAVCKHKVGLKEDMVVVMAGVLLFFLSKMKRDLLCWFSSNGYG